MKKNSAGCAWSVALLALAILSLLLFFVTVLHRLRQTGSLLSNGPGTNIIELRTAAAGLVELALAIGGMNARKWRGGGAKKLFILGLIASILYFVTHLLCVRLLFGAMLSYRGYLLFVLANLAVLIGYTAAFKMKKEKPNIDPA